MMQAEQIPLIFQPSFQIKGGLNTNDFLFLDGNLSNGSLTAPNDSDILHLTEFEGVLGIANSYIEGFGGDGRDEISAGANISLFLVGLVNEW